MSTQEVKEILAFPSPPTLTLPLCTSKLMYGFQHQSAKVPVKNNAVGRPSARIFVFTSVLTACTPSGVLSEGIPNSEGTKSFTPAALATSAMGTCSLSALSVRVVMTTSTPLRAVETSGTEK